MIELQESEHNATYIFCYGSNHPEQLSRRIEVAQDDLMSRAVSCTLQGWERGYGGLSKTWGGKSPCTVVQSEGSFVEGYAVKLTPEEVAKLDVFENYPKSYDRVKVRLTAHVCDPHTKLVMDQDLVGETYVMNNHSIFGDPVDAYLEACSKTLFTHKILKGIPEEEASRISLVVKRAHDLEYSKLFETIIVCRQ